MRVGCLADLHGYLPKIEPGQLDLLLIAGDVGVTTGAVLESFPGYSRLLLELADWLEDVDCPIVGVAGNHDFGFEGRFGEVVAKGLPNRPSKPKS